MRAPVDVIVPVRASRAALARLAERLQDIDFGPRDTVTIVDNSRLSVSRGWSAAAPVTVLRAHEPQSSYHARNVGATIGSGEGILFIDADVDVPPDLIGRYFEERPAEHTAVLTGAVRDQGPAAGGRESLAGRYARLRRLMDHDSGLDLGCGDGRASGPFLSEMGCDYVGVDVSDAALSQAGALGLSTVKIEDAASLPFEDGEFDSGIAIEVFEHLFDAAAAAAELARVVKPGGTLIAEVPNVAHWRHRLDFGLRGRFNPMGDRESIAKPWRDPHIRFFGPATLRTMLAEAGWTVQSVTGFAISPLRDVPILGSRVPYEPAGPRYQRLVRRAPGALASFLLATGVRA